jgi:polar amino acid transport system permease protein
VIEGDELTQSGAGRPDDIKAVPVRRPGRWIGVFVTVVVCASLIRFAVTDSAVHWHIVGQYLFDPRILHGVIVTMYISVIAMIIGIVLGVVLAVMRLSPNPVLKSVSWFYIWFFRGTPLLVQITFWYSIVALFPHNVINLGIPFGPALFHPDANAIITPLVAGILALGFNEGAYMAEVVRAGIISVPEGQGEAAASLGMNRIQIMRKVVLPQAMRVIIPPTGNEFISMLKNSSLVSTISVFELFFAGTSIYSVNYDTIQLLIVVSIWYLVMTSVLYVGQYFLERKYGQGFSRSQQATLKERWLSLGRGGSSFGIGGGRAE